MASCGSWFTVPHCFHIKMTQFRSKFITLKKKESTADLINLAKLTPLKPDLPYISTGCAGPCSVSVHLQYFPEMPKSVLALLAAQPQLWEWADTAAASPHPKSLLTLQQAWLYNMGF